MINPKDAILNMDGYFVPMYENDWDIKIDSNENNYGPSPKVLEALKNISYKDVSFYPYYGELSQKIANVFNLELENIKVTNGADEALQGIIQTYLSPKEILLTLDVSFEMPCIYTKIQDGEIKRIPFEKKWEFPTKKFIEEIKNNNVKIVYLASPNNPTGNIIEDSDLIEILNSSKDKIIILDETYANYADQCHSDIIKQYDNLFVVRSFSKDFALAGMRLGYILSNENNIKNLKKVISPFSVNSLAMKAGIASLNDFEYFKNIKIEIENSKKELTDFFKSLNFEVYPSKANFLLINAEKKAEFIYRELKKRNISIKLFKKGSRLENHIRITIPTKQGVNAIKEALTFKPFLVFDMDGVLINAKNSYRLAIEKTYEHFAKKSISQEEIQQVKNLGGLNNDWDLTKYLLDRENITVSYDNIVDVFQKFYWDEGKGFINNETPLFNECLFDELSKKYNLAIFTGRLKNEAMFALEKFNVANYFYPIITTTDIPEGMGKPNPYGINMVKEMTLSSQYYYLGDTIDDVKAGYSADCIAVGVLPPQDKTETLKQSLKDNNAKYVINSINDIETILEKQCEKV